jgi:anti-sigma factor RsiW
MRCSDTRAAMLVADRPNLRGADGSELARHLRECDACRSLAAGIERDTTLLASALATRGSASHVALPAPRHWPGTRAAILVGALPIAATIVLAVLLQRQGRDAGDAARREVLVVHDRIASNVVSVDVGRGQRATVIRTKDPKVTIVWISPGDTQ